MENDFLEAGSVTPQGVMAQLQNRATALKKREIEVEALKQQLEAAEKELFALRTSIAEEFHTNGVNSITDSNGVVYTVVTESKCAINKNAADKHCVAEWLKGVGASHLVKEQFNVIGTPQNRELLEKSGVAFESVEDMNTNAVKSFVLGALGQKESPAIIITTPEGDKPLTVADLPKGLNLFQYDTVKVKG